MLRRPLLRMFLAVALAVAFVWGLAQLFVLRYQVGDIYPPYSSLRADPLGTKALATALDELPNVEVRRNFKPLPKLHPDGPVTLVYAGVGHQASWTSQELLAFDTLVLNGSRAVFTFFPVETPPTENEEKRAKAEERRKKKEKIDAESGNEKKKDAADEKKSPESDKKGATRDWKKTKDKKSTGADEGEPAAFIDFAEVAKRLGFNFGYLPEEKGKSYYRHAALIEPGGHMESDISWHSALYFRDLKPPWKVLYMCGTMPVIIERQFGHGSIVLVADSFLVSNEALRGERHPQLLSRLFAGPPTVIFDEEHNNLRENPGIASLARKYRLHGVIAGLALLALFFVWKNMVRFIPAYAPSTGEGNVVAGRDSGEGFINLLHRSISPSAVFGVCVAEWRKSFRGRPREQARVDVILAQEEVRPVRERNPLETYRTISRAIARKI
ncbi:MAG: DUF4350 domain-containing protein [Chthoniobacter sp.]|uniref:DUF4350 domain-containing protein n=1 Tax=Chthoniobacter sp. TaxID=2510640 RepID=UPI0032A17AA8